MWLLGLLRLRLDVDVIFAQLRALERILKAESGENIKPEQKIFTEVNEFYKCSQINIEELKELKSRYKYWGFLKIYTMFVAIFLLLYALILLRQLCQLLS